MEIQKVALIGAGAIGGFLLYGFDGSNVDYCLLADGSRKERLEKEGIKVNDKHLFPKVCTPSEAGIQDLVIISTKYAALPAAIKLTSQVMGKDTIVLSVLNGIDSEEIVAESLGKEHVLHSLMKVTSRRYPDRIEFVPVPRGGIIYGNAYMDAEKGPAVVAAVTELLDKTSVPHRLASDILEEMWYKYAGNVASNLPQAVVGCGNGIYTDSEHAAYIRNRLWKEVTALAAAYGVRIPDSSEPWTVAKSARFSTLQDIDAGRPTEVDMFAGTLARKSKEKGLEAPFAEYTYHVIKLLEEKNAGLFDYTD